MDGRDIGSVVFPNADLKLFVTASEEIRAQRRFDELKDNGTSISLESVKENLNKRDYQDTHRKESPLIQVKDAIVVDNSNLSREEQLEWVLEKVNKLL
jgi:cytidylate kinase